MDNEKILKLFKNFIGGEINLKGIKCIPVRVDVEINNYKTSKPYYLIEFKIENPNNVSYYYSIVEEELSDIVKEFSEYVNTELRPRVLWENKPKFYLNSKIKNKVQKVFDSVREFKFTTGTPFIGYRRFVINVQSTGMKLNWEDGESYRIINTVVPTSATLNGENVNIEDAVEEYIDGFLYYKESYYETEVYYIEVDSILSQEPLLHTDWIATYYETKFVLQ